MLAFPRSAYLSVAALAGLAACLTLAADSRVDSLRRARGEWRVLAERETRSLRAEYAEKLKKLEKDLADGGDYVSATKARRERIRVMGASPAPETTVPVAVPEPALGAPIELKPGAATLHGGVNFDSKTGTLTDWKKEGAFARWTLPPGVKQGGYDVELTWSGAPDAGGELLVREDHFSLRRTVPPTAGWEDFQTRVIGTLRVGANSRSLEISVATVKAPGLFQLKSVRLVPASTSHK